MKTSIMLTTLLLMAAALVQDIATPRLARATDGTTVQAWVQINPDFTSNILFGTPSTFGNTGVPAILDEIPGTNTPWAPDVDVDDAGNYVIVWMVTNTATGTSRGFLLYNSVDVVDAVEVTAAAGCGVLRATISRSGGQITLGWLGGGGYLFQGARNGAPVMGQTYLANADAVVPNGSPFVVASGRGISGYGYNQFTFGNVSSDSNGNPVFVYCRKGTNTGVFVKGYNYADSSVKFDEVQVTALSDIQYAYADLDCSNDGGFYVAYNYGGAVSYAQYDANGNLLAAPMGVSPNGSTQAWVAVAARKDTAGGTTTGCAVAWSNGMTNYWTTSGAMPGVGGSIPGTSVFSGAADGAGNFVFDCLDGGPVNSDGSAAGGVATFP